MAVTTPPGGIEEHDAHVSYIRTDEDLPAVAIIDRSPITTRHKIIFGIIAVIGAIAGYLLLWTIYWLFKLIRCKEGMGYGDFKLLAALGAWLGWQMLLPTILVAALVGAVVGIALITLRGRDRSTPMPFGPFLAGAGWLVLMFGRSAVAGYFCLFAAPP